MMIMNHNLNSNSVYIFGLANYSGIQRQKYTQIIAAQATQRVAEHYHYQATQRVAEHYHYQATTSLSSNNNYVIVSY